jgi:ribosomal protein S18 acetylase RimI-like enzyme
VTGATTTTTTTTTTSEDDDDREDVFVGLIVASARVKTYDDERHQICVREEERMTTALVLKHANGKTREYFEVPVAAASGALGEQKRRAVEARGGACDALAWDYVFETYTNCRDMDEATRDWCFELTKTNMQALYEQTWGWNAIEKRRELNDAGARFIVARSASTKLPVAFVHFRFEKEDEHLDAPVGYIYELQCEAAHQKRSLGEILVTLVEKLSKILGMDAVILTVLKVNVSAYGFYTNKMKYAIDDNSPGGDCEYLILAKRFN